MNGSIRQMTATVARNAVANACRGGAGLIVALFLPACLTKNLSPAAYAVYVFLLQTSAYIAYLDFGLHTALARFVARTQETGQPQHRNQYLNAGLLALTAIAAGVAVLGVLFASLLPVIYPALQSDVVQQMSDGLMVLSAGAGFALPGAVFTAVLVGLQRSEHATVAIGGSKLAAAILIAAVSRYQPHVVWIAAILGISAIVSAAIQGWSARCLIPDWTVRFDLPSRTVWRELLSSCGTLSLWSVGMLLVNGMGLFLLSYLHFQAIAYYSVAANLVMVVAGLSNAAFSAFMPAVAVLHARGQYDLLGALVIRATAAGYWLVLLGALPLLLFGRRILNVWVGAAYATECFPILQILVIGNASRLIGNAYSVALIGSGQQQKALLSPAAEMIVHFAVSLAGGLVWGAPGVALGTLAGGIAGVAVHILYNIPRTQEIRMRASEFLRKGIAQPAACSLPLLAGGYVFCVLPGLGGACLLLVGAALSGLLIFRSRVFELPRYSRTQAAACES